MKRILKHSFTCSDNATYDIGRILWALLILCFIVLSVYKRHEFDPLQWSTSASALLVSGAANLTIKRGTEPQR